MLLSDNQRTGETMQNFRLVSECCSKRGHCIALSFLGTAGGIVHVKTEQQIKGAETEAAPNIKGERREGKLKQLRLLWLSAHSVMWRLSSVYTGGRVCSHRWGEAGQNPQCHPAAASATLQVSFKAQRCTLVARRGSVWFLSTLWC